MAHRLNFLAQVLDSLLARDDTVFMSGGQIVDWFVNESSAEGA